MLVHGDRACSAWASAPRAFAVGGLRNLMGSCLSPKLDALFALFGLR